MTRTLTLNDYLSLANGRLQEIFEQNLPAKKHGVLRPATFQDAPNIQNLTHSIDGLTYPLDGLTAILHAPDNLNYVIQESQKPNPKDREPRGYSSLLSFSLAYPATQFPKILGYMPWKPSEIPKEHDDASALWLELKITHPDLQGKGVYRAIRTMQELAAHKAGYERIYLQSFSNNARDIHLKEGYNLLRTVHLSEPGQEDHDEYLMRLDLTPQRYQTNKEFLETAPKNKVNLYATYC